VRLAREKLSAGDPAPFRVLTIPCAGGEEPLSVVMAAVEAGLDPGRVAVDAMDISVQAIARAQEGVYRGTSFRGRDLSFRDRYFLQEKEGYRIREEIAQRVRFFHANLFDEKIVKAQGSYDAVFCRNLLIYLTPRARKKGMEILDRVITPGGCLFVGHAEKSAMCLGGYEWLRDPGVFGCRKLPKARTALRNGIAALMFPVLPSPAPPKEAAGKKPLQTASPPRSVRSTRNPEVRAVQPEEPKSRESLLARARELADRGDLENGRKACGEYLEKSPADPEGHFLLGIILQSMGDDELALRHFGKTLYLNPRHQEAMSCMAFLLEGRGEHGKALRMRERAQRILQAEP
ncbi:MAG: hypothetical protein KKA60_14225, partial [Proteobacteria bacterium]|nr:hypothetical protein [Pseudomonadota bacterium]